MLASRLGQLPARRGHGKDRGADPGDRRLGRGLGDLREEPPASAGGVRYELRVSRLAHGGRLEVTRGHIEGHMRRIPSSGCQAAPALFRPRQTDGCQTKARRVAAMHWPESAYSPSKSWGRNGGRQWRAPDRDYEARCERY
jgi:hypothetical protein